jgi:alpha-mannosidase
MEVVINPTSGSILSIHDYRQRSNRLSQQIALRTPGPRPAPGDVWRDPDETVVYSVMAADSVEVTSTGPTFGEIVSRGRLLDREGKNLAGFRQTVRLWFGSRVLNIDIEIDPQEEPRADPWNSYYACRFAWNDSDAELWRGVSSCREPTDAKRLEAPEYLEIETENARTTILSGGLPYHRRSGFRMVDTLLVSRGETARSFRLGVGIDLPNSAAAAWELLAPPTAIYESAAPPVSSSGWLFHIDAKNIVATSWEPLAAAEGSEAGAAGQGFRVRLLETAGKAGRVTLRAFRPLASARQIDFQGQTLLQPAVEHDKILLDFASHEWQEIEAVWQ